MSEVLSVMSELGVEVDIFDGSYPYVRIERQPLSKVIVPNEQNYRYLSAWREEFGEGHERDLMRWGDWRLHQENPIEGIIQCVATINSKPRIPILHLMQNITDAESWSVGIKPDDIAKIFLYSEDARQIFAAADNAGADGRVMFGVDVPAGFTPQRCYTSEELDEYIQAHRGTALFTPELVYDIDDPSVSHSAAVRKIMSFAFG